MRNHYSSVQCIMTIVDYLRNHSKCFFHFMIFAPDYITLTRNVYETNTDFNSRTRSILLMENNIDNCLKRHISLIRNVKKYKTHG